MAPGASMLGADIPNFGEEEKILRRLAKFQNGVVLNEADKKITTS
jgi:hypothetical protein